MEVTVTIEHQYRIIFDINITNCSSLIIGVPNLSRFHRLLSLYCYSNQTAHDSQQSWFIPSIGDTSLSEGLMVHLLVLYMVTAVHSVKPQEQDVYLFTPTLSIPLLYIIFSHRLLWIILFLWKHHIIVLMVGVHRIQVEDVKMGSLFSINR